METSKYIIHNTTIINEGQRFGGDVWINNGFIEKIIKLPSKIPFKPGYKIIDANGKYLIPGIIDDHVHFREPGFEYKGDIYTESRAAVAGGITSFMEMPNTYPPALSVETLENKYALAQKKSLSNYSFYMGASNNNIGEILKVDAKKVCGIKVFMGSSTGNLLVEKKNVLEDIFSQTNMLIATHCEDDAIIKENRNIFFEKYGMSVTTKIHPLIRNSEACYRSSAKAVSLAEKYHSRLHLLHLSTAREMELLNNSISLENKKITAEVCIHHLWFSDNDYPKKGNFIKWNPSIKSEQDRSALRKALKSGKLDIIATDHAPHKLEEKQLPYFKAPSGGPMVQHSLVSMLELCRIGETTIEQVVEKMCHNPSIVFQIHKRGFIREGYYADLVLVDMDNAWTVSKKNILYKCGWSPMEGIQFHAKVLMTFVNGNVVFDGEKIHEDKKGKRLLFDR